eukprot:6040300-Pleurochrysis_carterae.AAC.2
MGNALRTCRAQHGEMKQNQAPCCLPCHARGMACSAQNKLQAYSNMSIASRSRCQQMPSRTSHPRTKAVAAVTVAAPTPAPAQATWPALRASVRFTDEEEQVGVPPRLAVGLARPRSLRRGATTRPPFVAAFAAGRPRAREHAPELGLRQLKLDDQHDETEERELWPSHLRHERADSDKEHKGGREIEKVRVTSNKE